MKTSELITKLKQWRKDHVTCLLNIGMLVENQWVEKGRLVDFEKGRAKLLIARNHATKVYEVMQEWLFDITEKDDDPELNKVVRFKLWEQLLIMDNSYEPGEIIFTDIQRATFLVEEGCGQIVEDEPVKEPEKVIEVATINRVVEKAIKPRKKRATNATKKTNSSTSKPSS